MENPGTIELLLLRLSEVLQPLGEEVSVAFLTELGINMPSSWRSDNQLDGRLEALRSAANDLSGATAALSTAINNDDALDIVAKGVTLGARIIQVITSSVQLGERLQNLAQADGSLSADEKNYFQTFGSNFLPTLVENMIVRLLEEKLPTFFLVLDLLGLAEKNLVVPAEESPNIIPHYERKLRLDRLVDIFKSPTLYLEELIDWNKPGFDGRKLFSRLEKLGKGLDIPVLLIEQGGSPPILEAFLFHLQTNQAYDPPALGFEIRFPAIEPITNTIDLIEPWKLAYHFEGTFDQGVQGVIEAPSGQVSLQPVSGDITMVVGSQIVAERDDRALFLIGLPGGTKLEADRVFAGINIRTVWNPGDGVATTTPEVVVGIEEGNLTLDFSQGDGFLSSIIPLNSATANFSLQGIFSPDGVQIAGSGSIELAFPTHISLGPLKIDTLYFIGTLFEPDPLKLELSSALSLELGPLTASVDRLGANVRFQFPADRDGNAGPIDFQLGFKPPNGVGLAIDAGVVIGGGYLFFDFEREEYAGALELGILEIVTVKAIGLITTRLPDGSKGFSLLIIISAEFTIQLGFGFTLLGVGGLLGLNRTVKIEPLAEGVKNGGIESVLFPQNIVANAPRIISDLRTYFPPENDIFLIGPMAKMGWGTPTLVSLTLGIIFEIPGNIVILGVLKVAIPDERAALIIIQVNFIGAIEFDKQRLWFFATLFESRVLFATIEGGMGLLVGWGDDANFVITVGGFHPSYQAPALPFPSPDRLSFSIADTPVYKIRVSGYFAVTSNTVQFGARCDLQLGLSEFGVKGHISLDVLFQFSPFYFIVEISGSLSVKVFGIGLFSVRVKFSLEGPTPYRAKGYGKIKVLFFSFKVRFDITWGEKKDTTLPPIEVFPLIEAEVQNLQNWKVGVPTGNHLLVSFRKITQEEGLVLHPLGSLQVSQRKLPLGLTLDKVGNQKPSDANRFDISLVPNGLDQKGELEEQFPMGQFLDINDASKLSRQDFEREESGLDMAISGNQYKTSYAAIRTIRYEQIIIDTQFRRVVFLFFNWISSLFTHFIKGNAVKRAVISQAQLNLQQPFEDKIQVNAHGYSVAFTMDNKPFDQNGLLFTSQAKAFDYMNSQISSDPNLAESLHVIPQTEINTAA